MALRAHSKCTQIIGRYFLADPSIVFGQQKRKHRAQCVVTRMPYDGNPDIAIELQYMAHAAGLGCILLQTAGLGH